MVQKIVTFDVALKSTERQWVQKIPEVYTNDLGSVLLQFRITDCTDTELTGSTAMVLLKMRDGSFFQGPSVDVERTLNVFSYTLKENEGNHDGLAEIQLIVTIGAKEFATQKYNFKVITGLDSEVAREIMIYDWSTLTAEARAYIDQFTADEILRDAEFDNAQFDRNVAFNLAQNNRQSQFSDLAEDLTATLDAADANIAEFDVALETGIVAANLAEKLEDFESTNNSRLLSVESGLADIDLQVDLLNRGLGATMNSLALLNSTYPTGDTKDHIVAGNIAEVDTLTITAIPTVASNITITLNGVAVTVAVDPATDTTTALVATKIRGTVFTGWTTGGTGSVVTFTATATGAKTAPTFNGGTTGVTATFAITIKGENANGHRYFWNGTAWADGGIYQAIEVSDNSVGLKHLTELLNKLLRVSAYDIKNSNNWEVGALNTITGGKVTNNVRIRTASFLYAEKGTTIRNSNASSYYYNVILYNPLDGAFVKSIVDIGNNNTITTLDSDYLVKFSMKKGSAGTDVITSEEIPNIISSLVLSKVFVYEGTGGINKSAKFSPVDLEFFNVSSTESSVNLFDKSKVTSGGYYDANSLQWVANAGFCQSDFIDVIAGDVLSEISFGLTYGNMVVFKNSNNEIFSGLTISASASPRSFTVPMGAVKASVNLRTTFLNTMMLVKNRIIPDVYVPFGSVKVNNEQIKQDIVNIITASGVLDNQTNKLNGKSIFGFGDSIMRGYGNASKGICEYIAETNNMVLSNYAVSGSTFGYCKGRSHILAQMQSVIAQSPDYVVFNGLTNDVNNVYSDGRTGAITSGYDSVLDTSTFCGGLEACCKLIKENWHNAKVLFVAVHKMPSRDATGQDVLQGLAKEIFAKWAITTLDFYNEGGLNTYITVMFNTYTSNNVGVPDGTHPNGLGYETFYVNPVENKLRII